MVLHALLLVLSHPRLSARGDMEWDPQSPDNKRPEWSDHCVDVVQGELVWGDDQQP